MAILNFEQSYINENYHKNKLIDKLCSKSFYDLFFIFGQMKTSNFETFGRVVYFKFLIKNFHK